ncbi:hypothetical protein V6N12_024423 [Hibiscus sabdariffa]|uniref:RNase H type-1 domain-containing protein n=1 Tax=Hibiscus sabdariffa TaxID=183260 RepID=A0ABR2G192_9ROSI
MYLRLEYAWELGARKVIFEVDSADAVFTVQHRRKGLVNRVADGLAKVARLNSLECEYFEASPAGIDALLLLDVLEAGLE